MSERVTGPRWIPHAWSVLLPVLMLGPALGPGYVLSYDMVWVPQLAFRSDFVGGGAGQPRAVPSDAIVAVLDNVVPGMLLQKLVLLGALVAAAQGARVLVGRSMTAQTVAVTLAVWNPFVAERLGIGQWPVLVGYAAMLWIVAVLARGSAPDQSRIPWPVWLLVPLGCISASTGIVTALTLLVVGAGRDLRRNATLALLAIAGNAPWLVAGFLHAGNVPDDLGIRVFGPRAEGGMPAPVAALGLGGIWNREVVPPSRTGWAAWVALAFLIALAAFGARAWWRSTPRPGRLVALWAIGYAIVVVTWALPGTVESIATAVPGVGLFRDGSRYLLLCVPLVLGVCGAGAEVVVRGISDRIGAVPGGLLAWIVCVLVPVVTLVDAAWGLGGLLRPADYPSDWAPARSALARAEARRPGDVLVLPFSSYRAPAWNQGRKVFDPLGRYLTPDYVTNDRLRIGSTTLPGDDPRVPKIAAALARHDPAELDRTLRAEGIRYVVVDRTAGRTDRVPEGRVLVSRKDIEVLELTGRIEPRTHGVAWSSALGIGWAAYLGVLLAGLVAGVVALLRRATRTIGY